MFLLHRHQTVRTNHPSFRDDITAADTTFNVFSLLLSALGSGPDLHRTAVTRFTQSSASGVRKVMTALVFGIVHQLRIPGTKPFTGSK